MNNLVVNECVPLKDSLLFEFLFPICFYLFWATDFFEMENPFVMKWNIAEACNFHNVQ